MNKILSGFDDITLIPQHSSLQGRNECDISINILNEKYDFPLVISPMCTITTPEMIYGCYKNNIMITLHRYFNNAKEQYDYLYNGLENVMLCDNEFKLIYGIDKENKNKNLTKEQIDEINHIISKTYLAVGGIKKYKEWIDWLIKNNIKRYCVDMAHGDIDECINTCKYIKEQCPEAKIMSGNYALYEGVINNPYADLYRIGISCGSCCTTARNTGFGMPTFESLLDCRNRKENELIIADGGIKVNGDIVKSMAAYADLVMCGYLFAGTLSAGGMGYTDNFIKVDINKYNIDEIYYKSYCGMASKKAKSKIKMNGSIEGESGLVKCTGNLQDVINNIKENLKSALAYCGARNWHEFQSKVKYAYITSNACNEGKARLIHES